MGIYTGKVIRIGRIRANGRNLAVHMSINGRTCDRAGVRPRRQKVRGARR
jgi:hypothetical protein